MTTQIIFSRVVSLLAAGLWLGLGGSLFAQNTVFTYQGRLTSGTNVANGKFDLRFALFDASGGGTQFGTTITNAALAVSNGFFTIALDFGANFDGADRWLEIGARTNGVGAFTSLIPRQKLTPTPYAITAGGLSGAANQPLILTADGWTALRLERASNESNGTNVNVIGGYAGNVVSNGVVGAFIGGGGGAGPSPNRVGGDFASVLGGAGNTASAFCSSAIGYANEASGFASTAIGASTKARGGYSTAIGYATHADGFYSTAMGYFTHAIHSGSFVWADNTVSGFDFYSVGDKTFNVRAEGGVYFKTAAGVGINITNPVAPLHVAGGADVGLGGGGYFVIGPPNGANIGMDNNEIMARNNGAIATLFLNNNGGLVYVGGDLGVARTPTANALEVNGNASKSASGGWLANSDARIKQDIEPVSGALEKLAQVRPVSFRYTDEYRTQHRGVEDRRYFNVVAQEFRKVFPDDVKSSGEKLSDGSEILQVDTYPLTIYSAAAIQELNRKVEAHHAENLELKARLEKLERLINEKNGGAK